MRLQPIENPRSPLLRLGFWMSRRRFGKVLTVLKVIYARKPRLAMIAGMIASTLENHLTLEPELRFLLSVHVARLNGCSFCADLNQAAAVQARMGRDRFLALDEYRTSPLFSESERAALAYVEEATRTRKVSDTTFAALRAHFDETQVVEITWLNAAENYFNLQAGVLGVGSDGLLAALGGERA